MVETTAAANEDIYEVAEPDWGVLMFWEDLTFMLQRFWELIKSLF